MSLLAKFVDFIRPRRGVAEREDAATPSAVRTGDYTQLLGYYGGVNAALSIATVYRCVNLLSESVANLPLQYMRLKDGIFVEDTNSRLHYLLTVQPDSAISAFDFWAQVVENILLDGNAYIVPMYNTASMDIERLALCRRGTVSHDVYNDTYTVCDEVGGIYGTFEENEILHFRGLSIDGKNGISVLNYARLTLDIGTSGDGETLNRFRNGGNVRGLITNERGITGYGVYQDNELQKVATDIDAKFSKGGRIVSLPGRVDFKQISLSSTDMQFLESRKFTVREICRFFGVHPSFVFDDTSNNYKSAEMANVAFLSNTLNPILRKIENELHRKLIAPSLCCKRKFQFDRRGLYACDLDSRVKYQMQTIQTGLYTVNEWRREENKPPVEGGDTVLVSANLRNIVEPQNSESDAPQQEPGQEPQQNKEPQNEDNNNSDEGKEPNS